MLVPANFIQYQNHFLQASDTFKTEDTIYMYALLPEIWDNMLCQEKKNVYDAIEAHRGVYAVELCKALYVECVLPYK